MKNIINYAQDINASFENEKVNVLDSMIFSLLSYCHFNLYPEFKEIKDIPVNDEEVLFHLTHKSLGEKSLRDLLKVITVNPRFADVKVLMPVDKIEIKTQMQFSAVTFELAKDQYYISFRGTSATTIGWKENFNMSFQKEVPAQYFAKKYFRKIKNTFPGKYYLGGHSKGGNLAFYVGLTSSKKYFERIDCFDGPGFYNQKSRFDDKLIENLDIFHKYIPEDSLIGILQDDLINNSQYCKVVQSDAIASLQHNLFTWQIKDHNFELGKLASPSEVSWQAIGLWLSNLNESDRRDFVEMLYSVISYSDEIYLKKIFHPQNTLNIANRLHQSQNNNSALWQHVLSSFANAYIESGKDYFSQRQQALISSMQTFIKDLPIQQRVGILNNIVKGSKIKSDKRG